MTLPLRLLTMRRVRFVQAALSADGEALVAAGTVVVLPDPLASLWVRRGFAVFLDAVEVR